MAALKPYVAAVDPVGPNDPLSSFALALMEHGGVPVLVDKALKGVVHADIVADREHPPQAQAHSMLSNPLHVDDATEPTEAAAIMIRERVRALPVLIDGGYEGMVTERALLELPVLGAIRRPVSEVASPEPFTVTKDATIGHARAVMRQERIGRLPVVDASGALVGLLEWPHLIGLEARRQDRTELSFREPQPQARLPVTVAMDTAPLTVGLGDSVADVATRMREKHQTAAVLVTDGIPVGIVTCEDLLELVATPPRQEAIWVQATGLNGLDPLDRRLVERHLQESLTRLGNTVRDPEYLYLHVKTYHEGGNRRKFSVRARLADAKNTINARSHGYDLPEAVDVAMERLERIARGGHDRRVHRARANSPRHATPE